MNAGYQKMIIIFAVVVLLLSSCSGGLPGQNSNVEPTVVPIVKAAHGIVSEGRLVPRQEATLSFVTTGRVTEVLVKVGDKVNKGDVLGRLGNWEELQANIARAELELLNAKQAYDQLAELAETSSIDALRRISTATKAVRDAQYQLDNYTVPASQKNLDPMEAVSMMKEKLDQARKAFDEVKARSEGDSVRKARKETLDQAQSDYNTAVRRLEYEIRLQAAEADLQKAMQDYAEFKEGPKKADVEAAQSRIVAAEAALEAAQAALNNLELIATISGTIIDLDMIVGDQVGPTLPVVKIADFSEWVVETDDLTEIDVVKVSVGQKVTVVADALPDMKISGVVDRIDDVFAEKRGDITYTVYLLLDQVDPRLRWGMTVIVTFEE